jgi:biotin-dependent carboxylase-like uncharacterized protein
MGKLIILKPGFQTSIQDQGRFGYRNFGVPVSGAMDQHHATLANLLVRNTPENPLIEITLSGPEIEFFDQTFIAITGADISPEIDGKTIDLNKMISIEAGLVLNFGKLQYGVRAYIGIHGLSAEKSMGSCSQYPEITSKSKLEKGDWLKFQKTADANPAFTKVKIDRRFFEILDVFPGPEFDSIDQNTISRLLAQRITIKENNRMGYQLEPSENLTNTSSIITSNVVPGTVQLTPAGRLIVLMRDGQVTGGYPRIFQLTEKSINQLSQKQAGTPIQLRLIMNNQWSVVGDRMKD